MTPLGISKNWRIWKTKSSRPTKLGKNWKASLNKGCRKLFSLADGNEFLAFVGDKGIFSFIRMNVIHPLFVLPIEKVGIDEPLRP